MITITRAKNLSDEMARTNSLQAIEKAATTEQLAKLEKLANDPSMICLLDSMEF